MTDTERLDFLEARDVFSKHLLQLGSTHYKDNSYDIPQGLDSTWVVYKCETCGVLVTKAWYACGHLTKEECELK